MGTQGQIVFPQIGGGDGCPAGQPAVLVDETAVFPLEQNQRGVTLLSAVGFSGVTLSTDETSQCGPLAILGDMQLRRRGNFAVDLYIGMPLFKVQDHIGKKKVRKGSLNKDINHLRGALVGQLSQ